MPTEFKTEIVDAAKLIYLADLRARWTGADDYTLKLLFEDELPTFFIVDAFLDRKTLREEKEIARAENCIVNYMCGDCLEIDDPDFVFFLDDVERIEKQYPKLIEKIAIENIKKAEQQHTAQPSNIVTMQEEEEQAQRIRELEGQLIEANRQLEAKDQQVKKYEELLADNERLIDELKDQIRENEELIEECEEQPDENAWLIVEKDQRIKELEEQLQALTANLENVQDNGQDDIQAFFAEYPAIAKVLELHMEGKTRKQIICELTDVYHLTWLQAEGLTRKDLNYRSDGAAKQEVARLKRKLKGDLPPEE